MGLFSTALHVKAERAETLRALDEVMQRSGFERTSATNIPSDGPREILNHRQGSARNDPIYLVSSRVGQWLTIIEADYAKDAPDTVQVAQLLSEALDTFAIPLIVHDDDLMFYNLFSDGQELDGYNSCPQYFENDPLSEDEIEAQRHSPEELAAVLPATISVATVVALLNRGWWNAHDSGSLDEYGVEPEDSDGFVFEGERMTEFGTLLQLHGTSGEYPYAAWREDPRIHWSTFQAVSYGRAV